MPLWLKQRGTWRRVCGSPPLLLREAAGAFAFEVRPAARASPGVRAEATVQRRTCCPRPVRSASPLPLTTACRARLCIWGPPAESVEPRSQRPATDLRRAGANKQNKATQPALKMGNI